eukprot:CAMPEP_0170533608 /NCGR_PEP_ID=MMETSP0209-20121228/83718_1 /TAXON_ID=665100 ORGANISM="Litonotus pictus, Strain P1" /NCGR_SAMPLE_ID=MMETSP0209 /ASSEMBLY_ACC=CAM_ASM_000301 /LENGTH=207 /DNA_ID=CAMNT_0010831543 /DNA_START=465 /DNA_END=1084 /DNA_ORIENTATION=-
MNIYLKVAVAGVISPTSSIFMNLYSPLLIGEASSKKYFIGLFASLIGVYIMLMDKINEELFEEESMSDQIDFTMLGYFFALIGVNFYAIENIIGRVIRNNFSSLNINYFNGMWAAIISLLINILFYPTSTFLIFFELKFVLLSICLGFSTFFAFMFLQMALNTCEISKLSYIEFFQVVITYVFGLVLFGELLSIKEFIGGAEIVVTL